MTGLLRAWQAGGEKPQPADVFNALQRAGPPGGALHPRGGCRRSTIHEPSLPLNSGVAGGGAPHWGPVAFNQALAALAALYADRVEVIRLWQSDAKEVPVHRGLHIRVDGGIRTGRDSISVDEVRAGKELGVVGAAGARIPKGGSLGNISPGGNGKTRILPGSSRDGLCTNTYRNFPSGAQMTGQPEQIRWGAPPAMGTAYVPPMPSGMVATIVIQRRSGDMKKRLPIG